MCIYSVLEVICLIEHAEGGEKKAWWVKAHTLKQEELSSNSQHPQEKSGMAVGEGGDRRFCESTDLPA